MEENKEFEEAIVRIVDTVMTSEDPARVLTQFLFQINTDFQTQLDGIYNKYIENLEELTTLRIKYKNMALEYGEHLLKDHQEAKNAN